MSRSSTSRTGTSIAPANRSARSRAFAAAGPSPPLKLRGKPTSTSIGSYSATTATKSATSAALPDRRQRIRQRPLRITRRHPYARIPPVDCEPHAAAEALGHRSAWRGVDAAGCRENDLARPGSTQD